MAIIAYQILLIYTLPKPVSLGFTLYILSIWYNCIGPCAVCHSMAYYVYKKISSELANKAINKQKSIKSTYDAAQHGNFIHFFVPFRSGCGCVCVRVGLVCTVHNLLMYFDVTAADVFTMIKFHVLTLSDRARWNTISVYIYVYVGVGTVRLQASEFEFRNRIECNFPLNSIL